MRPSPNPTNPTPPLARGQPEANQGGGGPASLPRGPRHPGGEATTAASSAARRVPPVGRPLTPAVPATGRQPCAAAQGRPVDRMEEAAGEQTAAEPFGGGGGAPAAPPPFPAADPPTAGQAAPGARGCPTAPAEQVYPGGMRRRRRGAEPGTRGRPPGEGTRGTTARPPLPSPPTPPSGRRATKAPALHPPWSEGTSPLAPKGPRRPGGDTAEAARHRRPHHPGRLLPRGSQQASEPAPAHEDGARVTPGDNT